MNRIKTILGRAFPLALGLALSMVMIARICFDLSYDKFYEDADRIYRPRDSGNMSPESRRPPAPQA